MNARPVPAWFTDAKLGIFLHGGACSVPAWAEPVGELGAIDRRGPHRDLIADLATATRARGLRFGVYYSGGLDWYASRWAVWSTTVGMARYCRGVSFSFGYNRNEGPEHLLDPAGAVRLLVGVVSRGGNPLLNIGPKADGTLPGEQYAVLEGVAFWMAHHASAVHATRPMEPGPCRTESWSPQPSSAHNCPPCSDSSSRHSRAADKRLRAFPRARWRAACGRSRNRCCWAYG
ncbi:alpha-L-fucosidase [Nonomuraea sp. NPDC005983]|uniref:alpha-L-fucosidase n=1 Tax=Nonomuraea sp. NPDC005983 TaxID=3155595 RepID=UPI0033A3D3FB